jgi:hypothetical protein
LIVAALCAGFFACCPSASAEEAQDGRVKLYVRAHDPYDGKLTFKWVQLDGPDAKLINATAAIYDDTKKKWISEPYFIPSKPGTYTFQVSVKNEDGIESRKTFVLEAKKGGTE